MATSTTAHPRRTPNDVSMPLPKMPCYVALLKTPCTQSQGEKATRLPFARTRTPQEACGCTSAPRARPPGPEPDPRPQLTWPGPMPGRPPQEPRPDYRLHPSKPPPGGLCSMAAGTRELPPQLVARSVLACSRQTRSPNAGLAPQPANPPSIVANPTQYRRPQRMMKNTHTQTHLPGRSQQWLQRTRGERQSTRPLGKSATGSRATAAALPNGGKLAGLLKLGCRA